LDQNVVDTWSINSLKNYLRNKDERFSWILAKPYISATCRGAGRSVQVTSPYIASS